jgi:membrane peptidoglycan carboxypeptidase
MWRFKNSIIALGLTAAAYGGYKREASKAPSKDAILEVLQANTQVGEDVVEIRDAAGFLLGYHGSMNGLKEIIPFDQLNPTFAEMLMQVEDEDFLEHGGVNRTALLRVIKDRGRSGWGSTLDMQLVDLALKQLWHPNTATKRSKIQRKIRETSLARALNDDDRLDKKQLFALLVGNFDFWSGNYGLQQAARHYFDNDQDKLTADEVFFLVAIWKNPTKYNPWKFPDAMSTRVRAVELRTDRSYTMPTFRTLGTRESDMNLSFLKESPRDALRIYEQIYGEKPLVLRTTIDRKVQNVLDKVLEKYFDKFNKKHLSTYPASQGMIMGAVITETKTGKILARNGNVWWELDVVQQRALSMGSIAKSFTLLAYIEQQWDINPTDTAYIDGPISLYDREHDPDGRSQFDIKESPYTPDNYSKEYSNKPVTRADAMQQSLNTLPTHILAKLWSVTPIYELYKRVWLSVPDGNRPGDVIRWIDATTLQIVDAYRALVNGGQHRQSYAYDAALSTSKERKTLSPGTSYAVLDPNHCSQVIATLHGQPMNNPIIAKIFVDYPHHIIGKSGTESGNKTARYVLVCGDVTVSVVVTSQESMIITGTSLLPVVAEMLASLVQQWTVNPAHGFQTVRYTGTTITVMADITANTSLPSDQVEEKPVWSTMTRTLPISVSQVQSVQLYDKDGLWVTTSYDATCNCISTKKLPDGSYEVVILMKNGKEQVPEIEVKNWKVQ